MTNLQAILAQRLTDVVSEPLPNLTARDVRVPAVGGKAIAVIGVRRGGKTSFMYRQLAERLARGSPREALVLLGLEDDRLDGLGASDLSWLVEEYFRRFPGLRGSRHVTWCFDEVQVVPGWERFVRRLVDSEKLTVFLSGSSAKLLSREVATSLRGRAMEVLVHPFSFRESLRHAGVEPTRAAARLNTPERAAVETHLLSYLRRGGFPEAQQASDRDRVDLLRGYVDTLVLRDVVERHAVSNVVALRWLQRELLANPAGSFSISKFFKVLRSQGVAVGKDTLHDYLGHLEDAFLLRTVALHTTSERKRMVNPRKVYPVDPGLIPLFQRSLAPQTGHALETVVLVELERRGYDIAYVRTRAGLEVDFHASAPGRQTLLIQSCADASDRAVFEREMRALEDARRTFPHARALLITLGSSPPPWPLGGKVEWCAASSWLLDDDA